MGNQIFLNSLFSKNLNTNKVKFQENLIFPYHLNIINQLEYPNTQSIVTIIIEQDKILIKHIELNIITLWTEQIQLFHLQKQVLFTNKLI